MHENILILVNAYEKQPVTQRVFVQGLNRVFRELDESHLWPVQGSFNVTERAIRQARVLRANGYCTTPYEYALCLESLCGQIVNDPKNM